MGYARQQYGFGYGRIDLVAKHRDKVAGDSVSPLLMMLHPVVTALAMALFGLAIASGLTGRLATTSIDVALALLALLAVERMVAGVRASVRFHDWVPLLFPLAHLVRDLAWVSAIVVWSIRRTSGIAVRPGHSMKPRATSSAWTGDTASAIAQDQSDRADSPSLRAQRPSSAL